jgi:hypothetical protein
MRLTGRTIVVFVAVVGVFAFVAGWFITGEVRVTARRTDARLETLAAAIESYAATHNGDMPTSEAQFRAGLSGGVPPGSELESALRFLQVRWPPDPVHAPILEANGLPTGIGTLLRVNARLREGARGAAGGTVQTPPAAP